MSVDLTLWFHRIIKQQCEKAWRIFNPLANAYMLNAMYRFNVYVWCCTFFIFEMHTCMHPSVEMSDKGKRADWDAPIVCVKWHPSGWLKTKRRQINFPWFFQVAAHHLVAGECDHCLPWHVLAFLHPSLLLSSSTVDTYSWKAFWANAKRPPLIRKEYCEALCCQVDIVLWRCPDAGSLVCWRGLGLGQCTERSETAPADLWSTEITT